MGREQKEIHDLVGWLVGLQEQGVGPAGQSEKSRERLPVLFGLNKLTRNRNKIDKKWFPTNV